MNGLETRYNLSRHLCKYIEHYTEYGTGKGVDVSPGLLKASQVLFMHVRFCSLSQFWYTV